MALIRISPREYDILIRLHWRTKEIAEDLGVGVPTINKFYQRLAKKFHANSRASIIITALKFGVIELNALQLKPYSRNDKT